MLGGQVSLSLARDISLVYLDLVDTHFTHQSDGQQATLR